MRTPLSAIAPGQMWTTSHGDWAVVKVQKVHQDGLVYVECVEGRRAEVAWNGGPYSRPSKPVEGAFVAPGWKVKGARYGLVGKVEPTGESNSPGGPR